MENKSFSFGIKLKKVEPRFSAKATYLECVVDNHNKYYYLFIRENKDLKSIRDYKFKVHIHFGKMHTIGNTVEHKFATFLEAERFLAKKVKQKLEKEYSRVNEPTNTVKLTFYGE